LPDLALCHRYISYSALLTTGIFKKAEAAEAPRKTAKDWEGLVHRLILEWVQDFDLLSCEIDL
jgi:hypothetical protein